MSTSLATSLKAAGTSALTTMREASTDSTTPSRLATTVTPESRATIALDAGADERRLGAHERHRLALHVRAHEGAVRVVVLEERDQRGGHRDQLVRRDVHQVDVFGLRLDELTAARHETSSWTNLPFLSSSAFAWAMVCFSSSSAE